MPGDARSAAAMRERLGYYAMGVAIGLVLLGLLMSARSMSARRQAAPTGPSDASAAPATPAR
ncbi:MAG: hypothetical protein JNM80_04235 [Phycisphaerae bacterium]|nr:hypothetical protein [Phycisphaerae bacterium]